MSNTKMFSLFKISNSPSTNFLQEVFSPMKNIDRIVINKIITLFVFQGSRIRVLKTSHLRERRDENEDCENIAYITVILALKAIVDWNAPSREEDSLRSMCNLTIKRRSKVRKIFGEIFREICTKFILI